MSNPERPDMSMMGTHIRKLEEAGNLLRRCQDALFLAASAQSILQRCHTDIGAALAFHEACEVGNPTLDRMLAETVEAASRLSSSASLYAKVVEKAEVLISACEKSVTPLRTAFNAEPAASLEALGALRNTINALRFERVELERKNAEYAESIRCQHISAGT